MMNAKLCFFGLNLFVRPHGMIVSRVEKLAKDIAEDYKGETIYILCVLKGCDTLK